MQQVYPHSVIKLIVAAMRPNIQEFSSYLAPFPTRERENTFVNVIIKKCHLNMKIKSDSNVRCSFFAQIG